MASTDSKTSATQLYLPYLNVNTTGGTVPITPTVDPDDWNARNIRPRIYGGAFDPGEVLTAVSREFEMIATRLYDRLTDVVRSECYQVSSRLALLEDQVAAVMTHQHLLETQYAVLTQTLSDLLIAIKETNHDTERGRCPSEGSEERPVLNGGCNQGSSPVGFSDAVRDGVLGEIPGYDPGPLSRTV